MIPAALALTLLGNLITTSYRSVPGQTDASPYYTSTGEHVSKYGVAVSQDMLCPLAHGKTKLHDKKTCKYQNKLHYGDWIYVEGYGLRCINDAMHQRHMHHIDLWVATYAEEKAVGTRHLNVYKVNGEFI